MTRWECNSTGITVGKNNCRLKSLSRQTQAITLEFEVKKKINQLRMNFHLFRRDLTGDLRWRFITKIDNLDICAILSGAKSIPLVGEVYKVYRKLFPNLPQKCPIMPANYSAINVTVTFAGSDDMNKTIKENQENSFGIFKDVNSAFTPLMPNGFYKAVYRFSTKQDPLCATLAFTSQNDFRMNENNFK